MDGMLVAQVEELAAKLPELAEQAAERIPAAAEQAAQASCPVIPCRSLGMTRGAKCIVRTLQHIGSHDTSQPSICLCDSRCTWLFC